MCALFLIPSSSQYFDDLHYRILDKTMLKHLIFILISNIPLQGQQSDSYLVLAGGTAPFHAPSAPKQTMHKFKFTLGMFPNYQSGGIVALGWHPARLSKIGPIKVTYFSAGYFTHTDGENYVMRASYFLAERADDRAFGPIGLGIQYGLGFGLSQNLQSEVDYFRNDGLMVTFGLSVNLTLGSYKISLRPGTMIGALNENVFTIEVR